MLSGRHRSAMVEGRPRRAYDHVVRPRQQLDGPSVYTYEASRSRPFWLSFPCFLLTAFVAVALTFFSVARVDLSPAVVSFRHHEAWQSTQSLRVVAPGAVGGHPAAVSGLYAELINSETVRTLALRRGSPMGSYHATAAVGAVESSLCAPSTVEIACRARGIGEALLSIEGFANSRARATQIAARVLASLRAYVAQQQIAAKIPLSSRVRFDVVSSPKPELIHGRRFTGPLVALSTVIVLLALAALTQMRAERQ